MKSFPNNNTLFILVITLSTTVLQVFGHGRLLTPPGRSSIWRNENFAHLNPPKNYNDNELNCGGFNVQHSQNGGKCGECGDSYELPRPRANEGGGLYGRGIIVANYTVGQVIDVHVQLTANHFGYFEFRLCPHNNPSTPVDQSCLDENVLEVGENRDGVIGRRKRVQVLEGVSEYPFQLKLPDGLSCSQCVLQWHYLAGNNWGLCEDGTEAVGCGPLQETFRSCADIRIN